MDIKGHFHTAIAGHTISVMKLAPTAQGAPRYAVHVADLAILSGRHEEAFTNHEDGYHIITAIDAPIITTIKQIIKGA